MAQHITPGHLWGVGLCIRHLLCVKFCPIHWCYKGEQILKEFTAFTSAILVIYLFIVIKRLVRDLFDLFMFLFQKVLEAENFLKSDKGRENKKAQIR